jgi:hypothetical protein
LQLKLDNALHLCALAWFDTVVRDRRSAADPVECRATQRFASLPSRCASFRPTPGRNWPAAKPIRFRRRGIRQVTIGLPTPKRVIPFQDIADWNRQTGGIWRRPVEHRGTDENRPCYEPRDPLTRSTR